MANLYIGPKRSLLVLLAHLFSYVATQDIITIVGILSTTSETTPSATTSSTIILPATTLLATTPATIPAGSPSPTPTLTLVDNDPVYQLLGCYNELPSYATERALGVTGSYISPIFALPNALTVPLCLEACAAAKPPGRQNYTYAAVENARECYCGLTLSNDSSPVGASSCSSPCGADARTSCGGYGFLTLYELRSVISSTTSSMDSTSSTAMSAPTASETARPKSTHHLKMIGVWIGLGVGLAVLAGLVALLLWWEQRRYNTRKRLQAAETGTKEFIGGYKLDQDKPHKYTRNPETVDRGKKVFIGESTLFGTSPPPHVVQSEEVGKGDMEAPATWERNTEMVKSTVAAGNSQHVQMPTVEGPKSPRIERRRTFDQWKTGEVRPLSSESPKDTREPAVEEESGGAAGLPTVGDVDSDGHFLDGGTVEGAMGVTEPSSTSNGEELKYPGEHVDKGQTSTN